MDFTFPTGGTITQPYGCTGFALEPKVGDCAHFHQGIDYALPMGTPLPSGANAKVVSAGWNSSGFGNAVVLDIGNGFQVLYGHLASVAVHTGQTITAGTIIGQVGSTGASTGPHTHVQVTQNGQVVDPSTIAGSSGTSGDSLGDTAKNAANNVARLIPGVAGAEDVASALQPVSDAVGKVISVFSSPDTYLRIAMVTVGIVIVFSGLYMIAEERS
jgi:murein DD-endopeptidase MepM/ murein hydrolase activator NlpD